MLPVGYLPCTQDPPTGQNMARVLDEIIAEARAAEASGWDGCFVTEHHQQPDGYLPSPLLMAGLIGMRQFPVGNALHGHEDRRRAVLFPRRGRRGQHRHAQRRRAEKSPSHAIPPIGLSY